MKNRRFWTVLNRWWWLWVPGLGLGLRLAYVLLSGKPELSWGDEVTYDLLAHNLATGHGYCFVPGRPSLLRAPLYPLFLAGLYTLFGHHYLLALVIQALVGGLSTLAMVLVSQQFFEEVTPPIVVGCLFACHPLLIFATGLLYSETVYLFLLLLFTFSCLKIVEGPARKRWAVVTGVLLGITVLMKPNLLFFPLALILWLWLVLRDLRRALVLGGIVALMTVTTIVPWTVRNYRISGKFIPVSANTGLNLWQGNHPEANGAAYPLDLVDPLEEYSETERDRIYRQWALQQIRSEPVCFIALIPQKMIKFFAPLETSNRGQIYVRFGFLINWGWAAFLGVAAWGFLRTIGSRQWTLVHLLILYPIGLTAVFYGGTRYGMVVYPYLFLLAADPLVWLGHRLRTALETRLETRRAEHGS